MQGDLLRETTPAAPGASYDEFDYLGNATLSSDTASYSVDYLVAGAASPAA